MRSTSLEVKSDCGVTKFKLLIGVLSLFLFPFATLASTILLSPRDNHKLQDKIFIFVFTALCIGGLAWCIVSYCKKRRLQRSLAPLMRIDENGISIGADPSNSIPWHSVASIVETIRRESHVAVEANLTLLLTNGEAKIVELLSLDSKPERIVAFAKESLRQSRGLSLKDLECSSISCPLCTRPTENLKLIQSGVLIFLLFYYSFNLKQYLCCRECARKIIARDSAINLLTCHITWPVLWLAAVVLPQSGKLFLGGHDKKALEQVT